jgi:hypothetical protein
VASSDARCKSRLSLHLGKGMLLGEFRPAFAGCVRFVWPFPCAVGRDLLPRLGGSFGAMVAC